MDNVRRQIVSRSDIREIERAPYEQSVPLRHTYDIFVNGARLYAQRPALIQLSSGEVEAPARVVSYAALLKAVRQAANLFRSLGVGPQDAVALLLPSLAETHFALWGAQLAGRACPINFMLNVEHIAELLHAAGAKVLVALGPDPDFDIWQKAQQLQARLGDLKVLRVDAAGDSAAGDAFAELLAAQPEELCFARDLDRSSVAAYYHTGGTTGAPKLAMHTHGNEVHSSWFAGMYYGLGERDVMINGFPLFHVAGAFVYGAACFCAGSSILMPPGLGMRHKQFVANYWRFVDKYQVSYLATVPTVIASLLDTAPGSARLDTVKALYTGGSPLPTELANAFEKRYDIPVRNILGMTESAGLVSIEPLAAPRRPLSCGLPLPYTEAYAVALGASGPDLARPCPPQQAGAIVLRGPHVGPGYVDPRNNAGMYAEGGFLLSGDLGHCDEEGRIYITGRAKDVIIRGAHNIDPSMIEEAFAAHPEVQSCAAVGEPDPYAGELPVIFITLRPGSTATAQELLDFAAPRVPERAAVPKRVTLLETIPMTAIGKIFKPSLRCRAVEDAYADALRDLAAVCGRIEVSAREVAGGLTAEILVFSSEERTALEQQLRTRLQRYTVPYEILWQALPATQP